MLNLTLDCLSSRFSTQLKSQDKNANISRTKKTFNMKQQAFFIIFKELLVPSNCVRLESGPLNDVNLQASNHHHTAFVASFFRLKWLKSQENLKWQNCINI